MTPSRGTQLRSHQKWAQSTVCSENLLSLFLPKYSHTLHPHQCQSQRAGRKAEGEAASYHSGQAPWSQDHGTDSIPVQVLTQVTSTPCVLALSEPDSRKLYHCWVATHCQMKVSAASFWQRLNCCCYLSGKCISLGWRAFGEMALVQIGKRIQPNEGPQQGLSKQEGSCYHHPQELRGPFT